MKSKTILGADGVTKMRQITVGIHGKGGEAGIKAIQQLAGIKRHYLAGLHTEQRLCRNCNICIMCQTAANVIKQQQRCLRGRA